MLGMTKENEKKVLTPKSGLALKAARFALVLAWNYQLSSL